MNDLIIMYSIVFWEAVAIGWLLHKLKLSKEEYEEEL